MLPFAVPLTTEAAARWSALAVPRWVSKQLLPAGWVMAFVAATASWFASDLMRCTPDNPAVCGPDQGFAWWFVICLATPVLLTWMPLLGCLAGVAFAAAEIAFDDVIGSSIGFGLHGLACAVVAVWLLRAGAAQERAATVAGGSFMAAVPSSHERPVVRRNLVRLGTAAGLVLLGGALIGWYAQNVRTENTHLERAERVVGRVVTVNEDDYSITLETASSAGPRRVTIGVLDPEPYPLGATTPVLLDPQEPSWSRLVAEPQDATFWESFGLLALVLALLLVTREQRNRRALRRLRIGEHPALRVWVVPSESGDALVLADNGSGIPADHGAPIARLPLAWTAVAFPAPGEDDVQDTTDESSDLQCEEPDPFDDPEWDQDIAASFGRAWRGEQDPFEDDEEAFHIDPVIPEPAVLLGSLRDRGWALLVTEDDVLVPSAPLRVTPIPPDRPGTRVRWLGRLPFGPWRHRGSDHSEARESADEGFLPGAPVRAGVQDVVDLPFVARTPDRTRTAGIVAMAAALVGAPAMLLLVDLGWYGRAMVILTGGSLLFGGVARSMQQVRLTHTHLEVTGALRVHQVPWERLHGARLDGTVLAIAWEPDMIAEVGPFQDPEGGGGQEQRAQQVGALMHRMRERAIVAGAVGRPTSSRPGPAWGLLAGYAALAGVALWAATQR